VLQLLWKDPGVALSREEEAILSELLDRYYLRVNDTQETPRLDRFVQFVGSSLQGAAESRVKFFNLDSFNLVLSKYTTGVYAPVFCNEVQDRISDNRLICFDLFGLKGDPSLFPVVSLLIIETIMDKIRTNPRTRKEILIDEAWSILAGAMGDFIEVLFRTIRKSNGGVTIITQGITELANSPIGHVIKNNAATVFVLDHSSVPAMIPTVQSFFALTDTQVELLKSIRQAETWREFLLLRNGVAQVFAANVGPHAAAAFSTTSEVRAELDRLSKRAGQEYAINQYVESIGV
jgi:type IV secretory pathway VirB4 component